MYSARFDEIKGFVDVLEALDAEFGPGGIAAEGLTTEDFEKMDKDDLERFNQKDIMGNDGWETYSIREIVHEVIDRDFPWLDFRVEPEGQLSAH